MREVQFHLATTMEEDSSSSRPPNFSQEKTDVLVRGVQARSTRIYGNKNLDLHGLMLQKQPGRKLLTLSIKLAQIF